MSKELFSRMMYEPSILFVGESYRRLNENVINYHWNMVVTTEYQMSFSADFARKQERFVKDVFSKEDMQANLLNRKNLHVIRLLGADKIPEEIGELEKEDYQDNAQEMLKRITEIIKRNGIIVIEDFENSIVTHKVLRKAFKDLYPQQQQIHLFNYAGGDSYIDDLYSQGIAVVYKESINSFFEEYIDETEEEDSVEGDKSVQIYLDADRSKLTTAFDNKYLLETEYFATLLNVSLLGEIRIPQNMCKDYYYTFLKNSVREPQWFGYAYGFNLHRSFEDRLYRKAKRGLENVGKTGNKPLLVVGQTGTGKSISLAALAYKIFNEKKYPVVYINNPDINFYSQVEYKQKDISKKGSPAFNALDNLLKELENKGAKATLVVWDASSYSAGRKKCHSLYQALLSRGRKLYMISSAYELNEQNIEVDSDEDAEDSFLDKKFVECKADIAVSNEIEQLQNILSNKCKMEQEQINGIINIYTKHSTNFLAMLYQMFEILRGDLSKGVYKEVSKNLKELDQFLEFGFETSDNNNIFAIALKKVENDLVEAGIVNGIDEVNNIERERITIAKDEFIKMIAICSQFKFKVPYDFALRILGTYNSQIIYTLTKSTFFVIGQDYCDNYEISLRTPLEAEMYLHAKNITVAEEVECVKNMLKKMKPSSGYGQQQEARLCEKVIRIMGPNSKMYGKKYRNGYDEIIESLRELREERDIWEPILVSQEITYIREHFGRPDTLSVSERIGWLTKAIDIADKILVKSEHQGVHMGTRNAIIVESANSKLLLSQLKGTNEASLYKELRRDLREVIRYDSSNYHAYVTLLKGLIIEYTNEYDEVKKIELLESMCSIVDEIIFENSDVANSEYFQRQVTEIYSLLDDNDISWKYIDELVQNGSAAGLYVMARKILSNNGVNYHKGIVSEIEQDALEKVYELFNQDKYKNVVSDSEPCQYMLLNVVWLINNKKPIFNEGECWLTCMNKNAWSDILYVCNSYLMKFSGEHAITDKLLLNIKYIKALCLAQLEQYGDCINIMKSLEEDSTQGLYRVLTKHMICDEEGVPRKFVGRLGKYDEVSRSGVLYIEEFGKLPIYYHSSRMGTSDLEESRTLYDIEIGLGNIAPKAFRNVEDEVK